MCDRVAYLVPRSYLYPVIQWAVWSIGAIAVPLCTSHPAPELAHVISDSQPSVILYSNAYSEVIEETKRDDRVVDYIDNGGASARWVTVDSILHPQGTKKVASAMKPVPEDDIEMLDCDKNAGAMIIYTSGTTGKPKGVLTTYGNIEAQVSSLQTAWEWTDQDKIHLVLPLHHVHGVINVLTCGLASGATVEMAPEKFSPAATWDRWMKPKQDLTLFMAVPTIYAKLEKCYYNEMSETERINASESCAQFRLMVSGSSALPTHLFESWENISGQRLLERYGMTEIGMALGNHIQGPREPGKVGFPFPDVEIKIVQEEDGKDVTDVVQAAGDLYVRGPQVFKEYWGRPEATAEVFVDGWFKTGDIACKTSTGSYKILGRASMDIIKSGGYKLSALIIEREMLSHPSVIDVAVLGIPDPEWGQRVAAVVVTDPFPIEDLGKWEKEMHEFLKRRVAGYEIPKDYRFVQEMPRNAMGKVNKKELVGLFL
ncbi:hypothetical protein HDV05_005380 [Chytridiales sp. JEL 0842]|nr:hypothetical protein HDV05_005380 [Chytridiales sp. JEL 0842]